MPPLDIIDRRCAAENGHDIPGILATSSEDVVWDDVGHPDCPVGGKPAATEMYHVIATAMPDLHLGTVRRIGAGELVVDEAVATALGPMHCSGFGSSAKSLPNPPRHRQSRPSTAG